eukprot:7222072-Lingulodinium_polyedra.AAC.1
MPAPCQRHGSATAAPRRRRDIVVPAPCQRRASATPAPCLRSVGSPLFASCSVAIRRIVPRHFMSCRAAP